MKQLNSALTSYFKPTAKTQAEMDAYDAKTWRIFCVLIVMLFVTGVTLWGIVS